MAAQTYQKCVCGHIDVMHAVSEPHVCRSIECDCEGFITKKTLAEINAIWDEGHADS